MISRDRKERFDEVAKSANVSASVFLERLIDHLETQMTHDGVPEWWESVAHDLEEEVESGQKHAKAA